MSKTGVLNPQKLTTMSVQEKTTISISVDECGMNQLEKLLQSDEIETIRFGKSYSLFDKAIEGLDEGDYQEVMNPAKVLTVPGLKEDNRMRMEFIPYAENVDFIERGKVVIRVMDKHNFYEAEAMPEDFLNEAPIGLLTKLWIYISRAAQEA